MTHADDIVIGNNVTTIGNSAFSQTDIATILIPISVVNFGSKMFSYCEYLEQVTFQGRTISEIQSIRPNSLFYAYPG